MIYLDNAATSFPKPPQVNDRIIRFLREEAANPGRSGHRMSVAAEGALDQSRTVLAKFFNAPKTHRMVFTLNGTDSLNIAIKGVIRQGDHVITSVIEHNSVLRPIAQLEEDKVITVTRVDVSDEGKIDPQDVKRALTPKTRLVVITHASNVLGTIQPINEIGKIVREHGAFFLVDAAQSAGHLPIDLASDPIDMLAFPGHKGLFGPPGTGGLYIGERINVQELKAWREGGTGIDSQSRTQPLELPFLLEGGTPNSAGIVGLGEGVKFIQHKTLKTIRDHEVRLVQRLMDGVRSIEGITVYGPKRADEVVAAVLFNVQGTEPADVGTILDQSFQIAARSGLHCAPLIHKRLNTAPLGGVRLSPGFFTTDEEITKVLESLTEIVQGLKTA